jgi:hypothetical protein
MPSWLVRLALAATLVATLLAVGHWLRTQLGIEISVEALRAPILS